MTISAAQLHHVLPELSAPVGGVARKVWCQDAETVVIGFRGEGQDHRILLSASPGASRAHAVARKPVQPSEPPAFVMLLRKTLVGARLLSVGQVQDDRLLRLDFDRRVDAEGSRARFALVAELTARQSNLYLLDGEGVILGRLLPGVASGGRSLEVWSPWEPPPEPPERVRERAWEDALGLEAMAADGSRSRALEAHLVASAARASREAAGRELLKRLRRHLKALERRVEAVGEDVQRAEEAAAWRRWGELLQSAYGRAVKGSSSLMVPDYYAEGMPEVSVPLDPTLDLKGNIERYFRLYRKYKSAEETILERLEAVEGARDAAQAALAEAEALIAAEDEGPEAIEALAERLEGQGLLGRPPQGPPGRRGEVGAALPYREFASRSGRVILVGKGGKANDTLTLKVARGNDLWLHARDLAGAHVVVRLERGAEADEQTLLDAATLAAHYSKGRRDTLVDVQVTRAKNVRKPKGLPPGMVTVADARTIAVRIEEARLERLFGGQR